MLRAYTIKPIHDFDALNSKRNRFFGWICIIVAINNNAFLSVRTRIDLLVDISVILFLFE